jgi:hypothetical protein
LVPRLNQAVAQIVEVFNATSSGRDEDDMLTSPLDRDLECRGTRAYDLASRRARLGSLFGAEAKAGDEK